MKRHLTTTLSALALAVLATGCAHSQKGIQARKEAHERLDTVSANVTYDQARQALQSGEFDRALTEINKALESFPENADFLVLQGRIHLESKRLEKALASFQAAQQSDPKSHEAFYYAGIIYQRWSDDEQAFENYRKASDIAPDNVNYLLAAAESLIALGEFQSAQQLIEPRVKYFEHNVALKQLQAQIAMLLDNPAAAATYYAEARLLEPDDPMILEDLAWAQFKSGQYADCVESLRSLRKKSTDERLDLLQLESQCLSMLDRPMEARDVLVEISAQKPNDVDVLVALGTVCWELKDYRRLEDCGNKLVALAPNRYEGYLLKGMYEKNVGDRSEAIRQLRQASSRCTDNALPHVLLGVILEDTGFMDEALLAYRQALSIDPDNADAKRFFSNLQETMRLTSVPTDTDDK